MTQSVQADPVEGRRAAPAAAVLIDHPRPAEEVTEGTLARIKGPVEDLVKYMLFVDESGHPVFEKGYAVRRLDLRRKNLEALYTDVVLSRDQQSQ